MKVLIAYDGTPGARAVFHDLRRAALPAGTEALVLTVVTAGRVPSARALLLDEARMLAEAGASHVRAAFPAWTTEARVVEGAPAAAIVSAAAAWGADLVVTGTRGLDAAERSVLGSVARDVVTNARCSVRVARPVRGDGEPSCRILVGFDASQGAEDAVAEVCRRGWPSGTEVRALAALDAGEAAAPRDAAAPGELARALESAADRLASAGLATSSTMRRGEGRQALLDEAGAWHPDAIFVGGRRLQRLRRFLFGSVAGSVADDAPCSVEVVRPVEV